MNAEGVSLLKRKEPTGNEFGDIFLKMMTNSFERILFVEKYLFLNFCVVIYYSGSVYVFSFFTINTWQAEWPVFPSR